MIDSVGNNVGGWKDGRMEGSLTQKLAESFSVVVLYFDFFRSVLFKEKLGVNSRDVLNEKEDLSCFLK